MILETPCNYYKQYKLQEIKKTCYQFKQTNILQIKNQITTPKNRNNIIAVEKLS